MCEEFDKPNGLAFSPDESVLYVGDSGRTHGEFRNHQVMTFDVVDDGAGIENPAILAVVDPVVPDGMRVDTDGNLYVSAGDGVQVFSPGGDLLGRFSRPTWQPTAPSACPTTRHCSSRPRSLSGRSVWTPREQYRGSRH